MPPGFTRRHLLGWPEGWLPLETDPRVRLTASWHRRLAEWACRRCRWVLPFLPWWLPRPVWLVLLSGQVVYRLEWRPWVLRIAAEQQRADFDPIVLQLAPPPLED